MRISVWFRGFSQTESSRVSSSQIKKLNTVRTPAAHQITVLIDTCICLNYISKSITRVVIIVRCIYITIFKIHSWGAWVAQWVKHVPLGCSSGHDLTVCGFKPRVRLHPDSMGPVWDCRSLSLSLSLSFCPSPAHSLCLLSK